MLVILASEEFVFRRAKLLLLHRDRPEMSIAQGDCIENMTSDLTVDVPGPYDLWLSEMEIQAPPNPISVHLNGLLSPWKIEFTPADLDQGSKTLCVPPGGPFRITSVDGHWNPMPHSKLTAYDAGGTMSNAAETTLELTMDENGAYATYGNPTGSAIVIHPGFGILIEHLSMK